MTTHSTSKPNMKPLLDPPKPEVKPGTRAFIIGNGRSLKPDQLDRLHENNDVCFGVNRIHLIYGSTPWRPTYWFLTDLDGKKTYVEDIPIHAKGDYKCYVRCDIMARCVVSWLGAISRDDMANMLMNIHPLEAVNNIQLDKRSSREPWVDGKYNQGGSVAAAQQLALAWGYNPVYMIGCEGNLLVRENNHFSPKYVDVSHDERNPAQIDAANDLFQITDEIARKEYWARDAEIFNATVGGSNRTAIPKVDFWRLF